MYKKSVLMAQPNYVYGRNVFVPYSVGSLRAYAETRPEIKDDFIFQQPIFRRDDPTKVIQDSTKPAVACFSCYLWNWEYNKNLAQAIRQAWPECLIVFGGTHIPNVSDGFFVNHPYVDLLVHNEGELTFAEVLRESLSLNPNYLGIAGLSVRLEDNKTFRTKPAGRIQDLSQLPSPYLTGVFDFMAKMPVSLNVSQETNRGCPFTCAFCDWGGNTYDKLHLIPEDRILEEFDWFAKHKVEYIFNCDANFGIHPRDLELTQKMIEIKNRYGGYPRLFRMCTAKNSGDRVFAITKALNDADMSKGATLSFQSMDPHTLEVVRRKNIKVDQFGVLMDRYKGAGIATYTELIMGMPGETYASSKAGVDTLIGMAADTINLYVYVCTMLPNSQMSCPDYVKQHGIKAVRMPVLLAHSTPDHKSLSEYTDVIVETATMSNEDWKKTYLFHWAVQAFHCLGALQQIAIFFHRQSGLPYSDFYERMIEYFSGTRDTLVHEQIILTKQILDQAMVGGRLDRVLPQFGEIYWPLEEASFLALMMDRARFYQEIRSFLGHLNHSLDQPINDDLLDGLVIYQAALLKDPNNNREFSLVLKYNFHDYLRGIVDSISYFPSRLSITAEQTFGGDLESYAREVVWYGRKGGKFHHSTITQDLI